MKKTAILFICLVLVSNTIKSQINIYQQNNIIITTPPPPIHFEVPPPTIYPTAEQMVNDAYNRNNPSMGTTTPQINYRDPLEEELTRKSFKAEGKPRYYSNSTLNLRTEPNTNGPIIAKIPSGKYVFVIGSYDDAGRSAPGWWYVYYFQGDGYGWVKKSLLISHPM